MALDIVLTLDPGPAIFEFQARPFYEKLGFSVFGTLEDHPRDARRYFLKKRLDGASS